MMQIANGSTRQVWDRQLPSEPVKPAGDLKIFQSDSSTVPRYVIFRLYAQFLTVVSSGLVTSADIRVSSAAAFSSSS